MDLGLNDKITLVTGAGRGIGRAVALSLAADGAAVVCSDMSGDSATETATEITNNGGRAVGIAHDVSSLDQAKAAVALALDTYGRLDCVANVAGAWRPGLFVDSTPDDWQFELDVDLLGAINTTRAALDPMIEQDGGKIVNVASDAGRVGEFRQAVYSGAKAGVIGFSKAVAKEVGRHNVHVNCVAPGFTKTPGTDGMMSEEQEARIARGYPLRKLGTAEEVAPMIVFLLSNGASHITGQVISVSGGYSMV